MENRRGFVGDVRTHPCDGCGGILDVCRIGRLRAESVIHRRHCDPVVGESARDLRSLGAILRAGLQRAAVEPHERGEIFSSAREVEIQLAALCLVFAELVAGLVGDVRDGPDRRCTIVGSRRGGMREEETEPCSQLGFQTDARPEADASRSRKFLGGGCDPRVAIARQRNFEASALMHDPRRGCVCRTSLQ